MIFCVEVILIYKSEAILAGDFNIYVNYLGDRYGRHLLQFFDAFDLTKHIHEPTHVYGLC